MPVLEQGADPGRHAAPGGQRRVKLPHEIAGNIIPDPFVKDVAEEMAETQAAHGPGSPLVWMVLWMVFPSAYRACQASALR